MEMLRVGLCSGTCPGPAAPVCCSGCDPGSKELKSLAQNGKSLLWFLIDEEFLISECHVIEHNSRNTLWEKLIIESVFLNC